MNTSASWQTRLPGASAASSARNQSARCGRIRGSVLWIEKRRNGSDAVTRAVKMTIETRELVSPDHAAKRIGVSTRRILQLVDAGQLPAIVDSSGRRTFRVE